MIQTKNLTDLSFDDTLLLSKTIVNNSGEVENLKDDCNCSDCDCDCDCSNCDCYNCDI